MDIEMMRAVRLTTWGQPVEVQRVPVPEPRGAELLIEVRAAGSADPTCTSWTHPQVRSTTRSRSHSGTRWPEPWSRGTGRRQVVDRRVVVVHGVWSCGECRNCRRGRENYCHDLRPRADGRLAAIGNGLGHDGGLAEA